MNPEINISIQQQRELLENDEKLNAFLASKHNLINVEDQTDDSFLNVLQHHGYNEMGFDPRNTYRYMKRISALANNPEMTEFARSLNGRTVIFGKRSPIDEPGPFADSTRSIPEDTDLEELTQVLQHMDQKPYAVYLHNDIVMDQVRLNHILSYVNRMIYTNCKVYFTNTGNIPSFVRSTFTEHGFYNDTGDNNTFILYQLKK
jgi:hypothetical protein